MIYCFFLFFCVKLLDIYKLPSKIFKAISDVDISVLVIMKLSEGWDVFIGCQKVGMYS